MIVIQHETKEVYQPTGCWIRGSIQIWEKGAPQRHGKMEAHCSSQNSLPSIWIRVDDAARQGRAADRNLDGTSLDSPTRYSPPPPNPLRYLSLDPLITGRADTSTDWREFTSLEGRKYYYNKVTKTSKWRMPDEVKLARENDIISHASDFGSIPVVKTSSPGADGSLVSAHVEMKNSSEPSSPAVAKSEKIGIAVTLGNSVAPPVSETTSAQDAVVYGDGFSPEKRELGVDGSGEDSPFPSVVRALLNSGERKSLNPNSNLTKVRPIQINSSEARRKTIDTGTTFGWYSLTILNIARAVWNPPLTRRGSPQPKYAARVGVSDSDTPQDIKSVHNNIAGWYSPTILNIARAVWNPPLTRRGSPQPKYAARVGVCDSDTPQDIKSVHNNIAGSANHGFRH
ncbi:hypothetical protein CQW23_31132 [Capsicum baccatum]|uniref:WW domain-containing protein n=1 Tax=Capsicum baccatum TaxID=33114 RepID=A0A2G2V8E2_CAPBA|nr:hypothetical protein CQW23_31132 [Capsicum baccatum]